MNHCDSKTACAVNKTEASSASSLRRIAIVLVCAITLASASTASANDGADMASEAGLGMGSVLASLIYGPAKVVYATGGVIIGGLAFLFSGGDSDVAGVIMTPSVRGDYVLTPAHLTGKQPIEFLGRAPAYRPDAERVASAPEPSW